MALDHRQLECFIAVAEEGNIGRAAARLHMTQPPLTRRIKRLERELGARLFDRTPQGVELTPPGLVLLDQARRIVALGERAVEITLAAQAGRAGRLVVGYFGSTIFGAVPELLARFAASNPQVEIEIERMAKNEQIDALRDGRIHIGFSRLYPVEPDMVRFDLVAEELFVAVAAGHRFGSRRRLSVSDLAGEPMILFPRARPSFADEVLHLCAAGGITPRVRSEVEDAVTCLANVAVGSGIAVVPVSAANISMPGVTFIPLADAPHQFLTCTYRRDDTRPVLVTLLRFLDSPAGRQARHVRTH